MLDSVNKRSTVKTIAETERPNLGVLGVAMQTHGHTSQFHSLDGLKMTSLYKMLLLPRSSNLYNLLLQMTAQVALTSHLFGATQYRDADKYFSFATGPTQAA